MRPPMAKRALTPQEEAFVAQALAAHQVEVRPSGPRKRVVRRRFWQGVGFWAGLIMALPLLFTGVFLYGILRLESFLGPNGLEWLSQQELTPENRMIVEASGYGWLVEATALYQQRGVIIALAFTVAIVIVVALFAWDALRGSKNEEEDIEEEASDENPA